METKTDSWGILELMGHLKTAGRITEEEKFGSKLGRIDVPQADGTFLTQYFNGSNIYRLSIVGEAEARAVALAHTSHPVQPWEMPKPKAEMLKLPPSPGWEPYSDSEDDPDKIGY